MRIENSRLRKASLWYGFQRKQPERRKGSVEARNKIRRDQGEQGRLKGIFDRTSMRVINESIQQLCPAADMLRRQDVKYKRTAYPGKSACLPVTTGSVFEIMRSEGVRDQELLGKKLELAGPNAGERIQFADKAARDGVLSLPSLRTGILVEPGTDARMPWSIARPVKGVSHMLRPAPAITTVSERLTSHSYVEKVTPVARQSRGRGRIAIAINIGRARA